MGKKEKRDRSRSKDRKRKKHKRSRSSSTSSSETSNIKHKKHKKDKKKKNKSKDNNLRSIDDIIAQKLQEKRKGGEGGQNTNAKVEEGNNIKSGMKPMTKAEYDQKQSVVRRVFDEDTGRTRLVKGDGEIIEEIVSSSRQKEINKAATQADAASFQSNLNDVLKNS